uniref:Leucine-rich repeat-containing N-terminal plant-type domain-containing protein n=1 Tax=Solanum lycopersicum TaxID=4081 RepID=K4DC43_SOLLC
MELLSLVLVNISSPIPVNLSTSLRYVDLSATYMRGVLPESLFLVPNSLENLRLSDNHLLKGVLPKIHASNTALLELDISNTGISGCQLSGSIPDSIGNLTQITELDLSYNHFTDYIPSTISKFKHLTRLDLSSNSFSGEIPDVFSNLPQLRNLYLNDNSFIGSFPSSVLNLTQLDTLDLSSNSLSGPLPGNTSMLPKLTELVLSYNSLNGTVRPAIYLI